MTGKHLGDKIHDLLDGRLTGDKAYAAMAHLGECEECAAQFHQLREDREALTTADAGIDMSFAQRLLDRDRIAQIAAQEPSDRARAAAPPDRRPVALVLIASAAVTVLVSTAWFMGAPTQVGLEFATSAAGTSSQPVAYMGAQGMRSGDQLRSWIHPDFDKTGLVPVEAKVMQRNNGSNVLVATLLHGMDVVVVIEEHATLAPEVDTLPRANVEGIDVYVLSSVEPSQVVWQTGDVVIALGCECALSTLESVAGQFPTAEGPGIVDRIGDGFSELAGRLP